MLIEPGIFRQTDHAATVSLAQYDAPGLLRAGHLQDCAQFRLSHPTGGTVCASLAAGEIAVIKVAAPKAVIELDKSIGAAADQGYQPRVLQSRQGKRLASAGKRPKADVADLGLPLHTAAGQPYLILGEQLAHQPAKIEQSGQTQYDSDDNANG